MRRHGYDESTWFTFSYSPVRDESGQVAGMYCACVEITEQVLAEQYRDEENERLWTLFEQAPGFMTILRGSDHVFELTNRAYYQLVGHRDVLGKPVGKAMPEVVEQGFIDLLNKVYASGEPFIGHAVPIKLQREPMGRWRNGLLISFISPFVMRAVLSPAFLPNAATSRNVMWPRKSCASLRPISRRRIVGRAIF